MPGKTSSNQHSRPSPQLMALIRPGRRQQLRDWPDSFPSRHWPVYNTRAEQSFGAHPYELDLLRAILESQRSANSTSTSSRSNATTSAATITAAEAATALRRSIAAERVQADRISLAQQLDAIDRLSDTLHRRGDGDLTSRRVTLPGGLSLESHWTSAGTATRDRQVHRDGSPFGSPGLDRLLRPYDGYGCAGAGGPSGRPGGRGGDGGGLVELGDGNRIDLRRTLVYNGWDGGEGAAARRERRAGVHQGARARAWGGEGLELGLDLRRADFDIDDDDDDECAGLVDGLGRLRMDDLASSYARGLYRDEYREPYYQSVYRRDGRTRRRRR